MIVVGIGAQSKEMKTDRDPAQLYENWAKEKQGDLRTLAVHRDKVDYLSFMPNMWEPKTVEQAEWYCRYIAHAAPRIAGMGFRPVILQSGVGGLPIEPKILDAMVPALQIAKKHGGAWACHGYTIDYATDPQRESYYSLRYRRAYDHLRKAHPDVADLPMILVTGHGDIAMAVKALQQGAYDFIEKPASSDRIVAVVQRAVEKRRLVLALRAADGRAAAQRDIEAVMIGRSAAMQALRRTVLDLAGTTADVLIYGETGSGKDLVARCLHDYSPRRGGPFVPINCGGLPDALVESELFGHEAGAFTGAQKARAGKLEAADGGTLFLDEIADMSISLQAKLLRVLQEGEIRPVGATRSQTVDVRIISATNKSLEEEVERGRFRQDLYYRLHVFPIRLPPLRERREDIPLLARHFLGRYTAEIKKDVAGFAQGAMDQLVTYAWPGNVRELENEVQRLVITCDEGGFIQPEHLSPRIRQVEGLVDRIGPRQGTLREMMEQVERYLLRESLREHEGNKTRTAVTLGITREGLHKKLAKYGM